MSLKFDVCYITGQWEKFRIKNATLGFQILFCIFVLFFIIKFVFLSFSFLFMMKYLVYDEVLDEVFLQQNINQSKTRIVDQKLSVELYL